MSPTKRAIAAASAAAIDGGGLGQALAHDLALGVEGVGLAAELELALVRLVVAEQEAGDLGRLLEADEQHAGGHRIERAAVAGPVGAQPARHLGHGRVRGDAGRLVDHQHAGGETGSRAQFAPSRSIHAPSAATPPSVSDDARSNSGGIGTMLSSAGSRRFMR